MATSYWEQLRDPRWQRRRLEIMQRDDFCCQSCHDAESTLNVHHKHYFKGRAPWEYADEELVTLCEPCHEEMHNQSDDIKEVMSKLRVCGPYEVEEAIALLAGWACRGIPRDDLERLRERSGFCFDLGRVASVLYDLTDYQQQDAFGKLVALFEAASFQKQNDAMKALVAALKGE